MGYIFLQINDYPVGNIVSKTNHIIHWKKKSCLTALYCSDANSRYMELSQQLDSVQEELNEAKMDKHESARHQKKQELLESMKRLFPGVYGRLIDLCQPVHKKLVLLHFKYRG